jgi:hypothetical protein
MRRILFPLAALISVAAFDAALAIDINPSKNNQPPSFWSSGGGSKFSIFNGDPKRIQRANAVNPKSFDTSVEVSPNPLSIKTVKAVAPNPSIKITFSVHNHDKLVYTETVDFDDLSQPLAPGVYTVDTVLANYPEMHAQTQFTVQP